jgi:hypothetical protein
LSAVLQTKVHVFCLFVFVVLGRLLRTLDMLGRYSTTELYISRPQTKVYVDFFFFKSLAYQEFQAEGVAWWQSAYLVCVRPWD